MAQRGEHYSWWSLFRHGLKHHDDWEPAWQLTKLAPAYDTIIVGGGGHGLATAYYLAKEHKSLAGRIAVLEKGWLGGGNTARNTTICAQRELARARQGKDTGVHRARKAMQRLRSILRLARKARPDWVARTDLQLQLMRRRLGRLRDGAVRVELVEGLLKREPDSAVREPLQRSLQLLREQREAAWQRVDDRLWERLEADWVRQARRFEDWPLLDVSAEQIERALQRARRRVRDELRAALGTVQRNPRHDLRRHLRRYAAMRSAATKRVYCSFSGSHTD